MRGHPPRRAQGEHRYRHSPRHDRGHEAHHEKNAHEFDPRKFLQAAMDETEKVCIERFGAFGSAGQATDICPIELDVMAQRYKAGALRQVIH